jgi:hypothetical protein
VEVVVRSDLRSNLPVSDGLPRQLYWIIVGLAVWLIFSVWGFFGTGYTGLALTVVSLFITIVVGLQLLLALIGRRRFPRDSDAEAMSLTEWLSRQFAVHTGQIKGLVAAIEILMPLVAVAFGMTIFALVHHFDVGA